MEHFGGSWSVAVATVATMHRHCWFCCSGAVKLDIELDKITIDQCTDSTDVFSNTHRCQHSTFVSNLIFVLIVATYLLSSAIALFCTKPCTCLFSAFVFDNI